MKHAVHREAVDLLHDVATSEDTLAALRRDGFGPERISLASCDTVTEKLGRRFRKITDLEDNARAPRVAYVPAEDAAASDSAAIGALTYVAASLGLILASSGGLVPMILAATAAGGAAASVGEALKWLVGHEHARAYEEQLKCGGLLLWVRLDAPREAKRAVSLLRRHGGSDVHLHRVKAPTAAAV